MPSSRPGLECTKTARQTWSSWLDGGASGQINDCSTMGNAETLQHAMWVCVNVDDRECVRECVCTYMYIVNIPWGRKTSKRCHLVECLPSTWLQVSGSATSSWGHFSFPFGSQLTQFSWDLSNLSPHESNYFTPCFLNMPCPRTNLWSFCFVCD